jgi:hypothetical protein
MSGTTEGIDIESENLAAEEVAFVQVKSSAMQAVLKSAWIYSWADVATTRG